MGSPLRVNSHNLYLLLFTILLRTIDGRIQVSLLSAHSRHSSRYFSNCTIQIINGSLYSDLYLIRRLDPGVRTRLEFQLRIANSKVYQSLLHFDFDICGTIIALKDHLFKTWYRSALKYGNFMENCPYNPDHYYIRGLRIEPALLPKYIYPGDYKLVQCVYVGQYKKKRKMDFVLEAQLELKVE